MFRTITLSSIAALFMSHAPGASLESGRKFYGDDPLWKNPSPAPVTQAAPRKLSDYYDFFQNTLFHPGEQVRHAGQWLPSQGVNTVDEVPDSAWFTNRHAMRRMSIEELQRGPGNQEPPAAGKWTVVAAKNEGVTPGFTIRDASGRRYVIKFDPLSNPEMASAADVISSKFFYALGYNVPENYVAYFSRDQIVAGAGTMIADAAGKKRPMRDGDIQAMLAKVPQSAGGRYRALASRYVPGKPLGPFRYHGTRTDDPNDLVPHEHRRDVRALRTICAWLGHDDSRAINTFDTLIEENGIPHVKHFLIDFGSSLGSASFEANSPRSGNSYLFAWKPAAVQFATLGFYAPRWQRARYPKLPATGRFEYEVFDPLRWVAEYPNAAFRNENDSDRAWAARKIAAFTDAEIRAMVATGGYSDPAAAEWVARCLIERRNKIVRAFLQGAAALDGFEVRNGELRFRGAPGPLKVQWSIFDNHSGLRRKLAGAESVQVPAADAEYLVADIGGLASVYVKGGRVVGVERNWCAGRGNPCPRS